MKHAYIETLPDKLCVRELIPSELSPVEKYYGAEFASHCVEVSDDVEEGMIYSPDKDIFYKEETSGPPSISFRQAASFIIESI